jgi:nitrate reductase delta subunit
MNIYTILSRLLDYPEQELLDNIRFLMKLISKKMDIPQDEKDVIIKALKWMKGKTLLELQEEYVNTFDMKPENSLHLTHHLFGDDRGRGPALVDLGEHYKDNGLEVISGELPDFLPLILEYVATLDETGAKFFLADASKVLSVMVKNLEESESPYAPLLRIIQSRGQLAQTAA